MGKAAHCWFMSKETQDWPLETDNSLIVKTVVCIIHPKNINKGGSHIKVSLADFMLKL